MMDLIYKNCFYSIKWIILIVWTCAAVLMTGSVLSAAKAEETPNTKIRVAEYANVGAEMTTLKDISTIEAPEFLRESFEKIEICRSPKPGSMKIMEKSQIESVLRSIRFLPADSDIRIPDKVHIKRDSQEVSLEFIKEKLNAYLDQQMAESEFELEQFRATGLKVYPSGELDLVFLGSNPNPGGGRLSLHVDVLVDGQKQDRFMVNGWISVYESVVCSATDINRGEVIDSTHLKIVRTNVSRLRGSYAIVLDEIEGKVLKTGLKAGEIINPNLLENRTIIQKGALVRLIAQKDNLLIEASGISKEDGSINQLIRVENLSSGKTVRGLVRDKTKVEVLY